MKNKKPKSLGEIAWFESLKSGLHLDWNSIKPAVRDKWDRAAKAVERAVIARLKREGKLSS